MALSREICTKLKRAGFPQTKREGGHYWEDNTPYALMAVSNYKSTTEHDEYLIAIPNLEEILEELLLDSTLTIVAGKIKTSIMHGKCGIVCEEENIINAAANLYIVTHEQN